MGLENSVLNRGVSLLEGFILTEIKALVTESTVLIRGVSANRGFTVYKILMCFYSSSNSQFDSVSQGLKSI